MSRNQTRILVVDDNAENINLLYHILTEKGYSVSGVPSGKLALKIVERFDPDIILLDVMMPIMDGYQTCMELKKNPSTAHIPVIFVTAKTAPADIAKGFEVGATDYISKPIKEEEVWARLNNQLAIKDLLDEKLKLIAQLRRQEIYYKKIIYCASNPMLTLTHDGLVSFANPAAVDFLGYSSDELGDKLLTGLLAENYSSQLEKPFFDSLETDSVKHAHRQGRDLEVAVVTKEGKRIMVKMSFSALGTETPSYLCLLYDLTEHKEKIVELKKLSHFDKLTNIANRRHFDEYLSDEWERSKRSNAAMALLFIDIDFFKLYNDSLGHQQGDECLQKIAHCLKGLMSRPADLVARYGGEEFVVVLPNTDNKGALKVAKNLKQSIEDLKIEHPSNATHPYVTISVGVASLVATQEIDKKALISAADKALYCAKQKGRNRVETHLSLD